MDGSNMIREYIAKEAAEDISCSNETEDYHEPKLELFRGEDHDTEPAEDEELAEDLSSEEPVDELRSNGFLTLNTHDTSFTGEHISKIEKFAEDIQAAANAVWPTRGRGRYSEVHVLLLSWEQDSLGVETEIRQLGLVFSNLYRYEVHEFKIPNKTPGKATSTEVSKFLEHDGSETLLIVYYAGHARLSHQANDPPIWIANGSSRSPTLPSGGVQQLLEEAESDVLLLYDSCHSSHPAINVSGQGVTEVIAACGFETQAPAVGPHSFTNALIRELEDCFEGPPISVAELHSRMIGSLKQWKPGLLRDELGNVWTDADGQPRRECQKRRTPIHCFLTNETPYRSVMLSPLPVQFSHAAVNRFEIEAPSGSSTSVSSNGNLPEGSSKDEISSVPTSISAGDPANSLQVLLAVRLEEDFFDADDTDEVRTWCEWLRNIPPGTSDVNIQGVYKSLSTLIIVSMPAVVWNLLPNNGAYSFIGFVRSDNLATGRRHNELVSVPEGAAASATKMKNYCQQEGWVLPNQEIQPFKAQPISMLQNRAITMPPEESLDEDISYKQLSGLQDGRSSSPDSTELYSRTPELPFSYKLAERKRRTETKELFEMLRDLMPQLRGSRASEWEILTKAISEHQRLQRELHQSRETISLVSQETETLRGEANSLHSEVARLNGHSPQLADDERQSRQELVEGGPISRKDSLTRGKAESIAKKDGVMPLETRLLRELSPDQKPQRRKHDGIFKFAWTFESLWSTDIDDCTDAVYSISSLATGLQEPSTDNEMETSVVHNPPRLVDETKLRQFPPAEPQLLRTENSGFYSQDLHDDEFEGQTWCEAPNLVSPDGKILEDKIPVLEVESGAVDQLKWTKTELLHKRAESSDVSKLQPNEILMVPEQPAISSESHSRNYRYVASELEPSGFSIVRDQTGESASSAGHRKEPEAVYVGLDTIHPHSSPNQSATGQQDQSMEWVSSKVQKQRQGTSMKEADGVGDKGVVVTDSRHTKSDFLSRSSKSGPFKFSWTSVIQYRVCGGLVILTTERQCFK